MKKIFYLIALLATFAACSNNQNNNKETVTSDPGESVETVALTEEQYLSVSPVTSRPVLENISGYIDATGMLDVPPQNAVSVMALFGGYVKSTDMLQGKRVRKGEVLCTLQDPAYIQLQQDYLDAKSQLEFLQSDYERQQQLSTDQAASQKTVQQAKALYESTKAKLNGLKAKLNLLNVNTDALDKGSITPIVQITSPINGYITEMKVNIGTYVQPQDLLFRIVDPEHLHAELQVFEKDIAHIKTGQKVMIKLVNEQKIRMAHVYLINKEISAERTVRVHCHLDEEENTLIPGTYLQAQIYDDNRRDYTLPESALVTHDGKQYVFVVTNSKNTYEMLPVSLLLKNNNRIVIQPVDSTKQYIIKGAYDLLSKLKNKAEE
jgi:cobalt-zinc-cadmium efflux system membrane fusion protein